MDPIYANQTGPETNVDWANWMQWDGQEAADSRNRRDDDFQSNATGLETPPHNTIQPSMLSNAEHALRKAFLDLPTPSNSSGSPESHMSDRRLSGETLRPEISPTAGPKLSLKRKSPSADDILAAVGATSNKHANKKRPHNVIEKRYRANLNDKIAELRDSVPSLRIAKKITQDKDQDESEEEDLEGIAPSNKLNKASILSKATEYIRHLELRNKRLDDENLALKTRLRKVERELERGGNSVSLQAQAQAHPSQTTPAVQGSSSSPGDAAVEETNKALYPPQGLIPLPDAWKKMRASTPQQPHYAEIYDEALKGERRGRRAWPQKFMLGSLAGLMVMEGFSSKETKSDSTIRGLFGIPLELLDGRAFLSTPGEFLRTFASYCRGGGIFPLMKGFFALTTLAFVVFIYLFNSKPKDSGKAKDSLEAQTPPMASPVQLRRRAWLTSIQTVHVPRHSLIPEFIAVTFEWLKYSFRLLLGWQTYSWITGLTEDEEIARVKAWDIAIDAQLTGGDAETSRSRLVLTIFASGTLPQTPARLMLKALHCRLLLWDVGGHREGAISSIANKAAVALASYQWKKAQQLQKSLPPSHPDSLPVHLAALVERNCDAVLLDSILQRASNMMWDRPTNESTPKEDALMDVVVDDYAVRAPLDAIAAWWSSNALRQALVSSFDTTPDGRQTFRCLLAAAFDSAPVASTARTRALVTDAVFSSSARAENIQAVLSALPPTRRASVDAAMPTNAMPYLIDSTTPLSACSDISLALQCGMIMAMLQSSSRDSATCGKAAEMFANLPVNAFETGFLGFAPVYHILQVLSEDAEFTRSPHHEQLSQNLQSWLHAKGPDSNQLSDQVIDRIDTICYSLRTKSVERRQSMASNDTGYASSGEAAQG